jgi:hypothetical protein
MRVRRALCSLIMGNKDCLFIDQIREIEFLNSLKKLKTKLSLRPDNIPPYILKGCSDFLVKPLHYLFNLSLKSNCFPNFWKIVKVVPIPRRGASRYFQSQPIAILSFPAKGFECIIYNRLFAHIKKFITLFQHGFFPSRSINSNLISF